MIINEVEASPTSSLARLFNTDDSTGNGGTDQGISGNGNGDKNSGSTPSHTGGSNVTGDSSNPPPSMGVEQDVFNKFATDVVSFEQQSATEKRLDNLLRQLAVAAQTDFTSVSNSVNALQQELIQTQQQLVQAWSIFNNWFRPGQFSTLHRSGIIYR